MNNIEACQYLTQIISLKGNGKSKKNIQRGKYKPYDIKVFIFLNLYVSDRTFVFYCFEIKPVQKLYWSRTRKGVEGKWRNRKKYHKLSGFFLSNIYNSVLLWTKISYSQWFLPNKWLKDISRLIKINMADTASTHLNSSLYFMQKSRSVCS